MASNQIVDANKMDAAVVEWQQMSERERDQLARLTFGDGLKWYDRRTIVERCLAALAEDEQESTEETER